MASKKKKNTKKIQLINYRLAAVIVPALLLAVFAGYLWGTAGKPSSEIIYGSTQTQRDRLAQFYGDRKGLCGGEASTDFDPRIIINPSADRILATNCYGGDALFFLDSNGRWQEATVNIIIGRTHYYEWLEACGIADIQASTKTARPENASIDEFNLQECQYINKHKQLPPDNLKYM